MRRDDRELQQQYSAPERSPGLTWKHWAMIVAAIIVIIVVVSLIHLVAPFMGWWGPALANVAGGTLLVCIPAIPIGLVLHFWQENKRTNYKMRVHRPTSENAYPIIDLGGKFQEVANQIAPPVKVPQNQHYAPTDPSAQRRGTFTQAVRAHADAAAGRTGTARVTGPDPRGTRVSSHDALDQSNPYAAVLYR